MQRGCLARSTDKVLHNPWCHFISGLWRVSLAEYIRVLRVYPNMLQVKFLTCWRWWLTVVGLVTLYLFLIYMLLSEDVTYVSSVFETYIIVIIESYVVFTNRFWNPNLYYYLWTHCKHYFRCNFVYMMCICLIMRSWLWCWFTDVLRDTPRTTGFI